MVNRNDAASDALLQRVIEYLRRQEIPEFPDPEIAVAKIAAEHPSSVRSISPLRRIIMNRRFQLSAGVIVSTAALLGFLLLWGGSATQPVSAMENAMEKMAESMQKAKSYKYTQTLRETLSPEPGKPPHTQVETETGYWRTPGSKRFEIETVPDPDGKGRQELLILPAGRPGIVADHGRKVFIRGTAGADESLTMPDVELVWELKNLGKFSGKPDRELGTKEIAGRKARGFEIDNKRLDPVLTPGLFLWGRAPVQIWLDDESSLPILCSRDVGTTGSITTQIQWNVDLDPKLFDPTPPEGYTDITPKAPTSEREIRMIVDALRDYRSAMRGRYPACDSDITSATWRRVMEGLGRTAPRPRPKGAGGKDDMSDAEWEFIQRARNTINSHYSPHPGTYHSGFEMIAVIRDYNPDYAYYGKTVSIKDKNQVLLRWKLDDGRYEVIFGDLRSETVTAERLRILEGK